MKIQVIPVTELQQNCSLLMCEKTNKAALVDAGGDAEVIKQAVAKMGVEVEKLLLTHGHMDHAGAAAELAEFYSVPIEGPHSEDQFLLDTIAHWCEQFDLPPGRAVQPDRYLTDGDQVEFGEQRLQVIHTPGHTPGHVCFFHAAKQFALVGDVLFAGSIGRTDFPRGDHATLLDSIQRKLMPLGEAVEFLPGHGPNSTLGREKSNNPYL